MAGRPTVRTPENAARIEQAIAAGATYKLAAQYAGMDEHTLINWRRADLAFSTRLKRAEAQAGLRWLAIIDQAATEDWRAAAWKLERRFPDEYGRTIQEHTGKDGAPLTFTLQLDRAGAALEGGAPTPRLLEDGQGKDAAA